MEKSSNIYKQQIVSYETRTPDEFLTPFFMAKRNTNIELYAPMLEIHTSVCLYL